MSTKNAVSFGLDLAALLKKYSVRTYATLAFVDENDTDVSSAYFSNVEDNDVVRIHILMRRLLGSLITMSMKYLGLSVYSAVGMLQALLEEAGEDVVEEQKDAKEIVQRARRHSRIDEA